jgi:uncharacterized protein (DUF1499 family)
MSKTLAHALIAALLLTGCTGMPEHTADPETVTELARCPESPNCVSSSEDRDDSHYIAPLRVQGDPDAAWQALQELLAEDSSFEIAASNDRYLRAVATTKILRFKDDVEFLLDRDAGTIAMRSASRIGYSDLGKNRKRMEEVRVAMIEAGAAIDVD